ncbi:hypothetical protein RRG08_004519 [Elysia crispata]|uniref:Uncharacterized protein n=1 Tax=Elysia crispata TaxID=231223 RepID=A0AAE1EC68_9GAST|nr:hypothetical protein RRG08_004519 [Elysia crispata]
MAKEERFVYAHIVKDKRLNNKGNVWLLLAIITRSVHQEQNTDGQVGCDVPRTVVISPTWLSSLLHAQRIRNHRVPVCGGFGVIGPPVTSPSKRPRLTIRFIRQTSFLVWERLITNIAFDLSRVPLPWGGHCTTLLWLAGSSLEQNGMNYESFEPQSVEKSNVFVSRVSSVRLGGAAPATRCHISYTNNRDLGALQLSHSHLS